MIIPVRCYTCGKVVGNLQKKYNKLVDEYKKDIVTEADADASASADGAAAPIKPKGSVVNAGEFAIQSGKLSNGKYRTPEGKAMDELGLERYCCRRMLLTMVDIIKHV